VRQDTPSEHFLLFLAALAADESPPPVAIRQAKFWNFFDWLVRDADGYPSAPRAIGLFFALLLVLSSPAMLTSLRLP